MCVGVDLCVCGYTCVACEYVSVLVFVYLYLYTLYRQP